MAYHGSTSEQLVEDRTEVHQSTISPQVIFGLGQERIELAITSSECDLLGLDQATHHQNLIFDARNCHRSTWEGVVAVVTGAVGGQGGDHVSLIGKDHRY